MKTKIIPLPDVFIVKIKAPPPLSPQMVISLVKACAQQHAGIFFGQKDIKGFTVLINRGLIIRKKANNEDPGLWQVTDEAILMLTAMGIKVAC